MTILAASVNSHLGGDSLGSELKVISQINSFRKASLGGVGLWHQKTLI